MKQLFTTFLLLVSLSATAQMERIRESVRAEYLSATTDKDAGRWSRTIRRDGTWPDIDYHDRSRSQW